MPNLSVIFRQEITRLARREIRSQTRALRKASAQYRREIAELKRQSGKLNSEVARLRRRSGEDMTPRQSPDESANIRFSAKGVISQRKRLGISAEEYGKLVGVTGHTIYSWEHGLSRPRSAQLSALRSIRTLGKREVLTRIEQIGQKAPKRRAARR